MHVGIPCMKCSLNPSSTVHAASGKKSKTCGVGSAWREMNDERLGRDDTIDKNLTEQNIWMIGSPSDDVEKIVKNEIDSINEDRKLHGKRALRSDAVSVIEIVEKPPMEYMQTLSDEEKRRFLSESQKTMSNLIHDWNAKQHSNWKIIEAVQHWDEYGGLSPHNHELVLISSHDDDGVRTMNCKKEYGKKFFDHINKNYSHQMRELGYPVEDVKMYDSLSEEEKEFKRQHPELKGGVDATVYKKRKEQELTQTVIRLEKQSQELDQSLIDKQRQHDELTQQVSDAEQQQEMLSNEISEAKDDLQRTKADTAEVLVAGKLAEQKIQESKLYEQDLNRREQRLSDLTSSPSLASYQEVKDENLNLKKQISLKDKIIESLQEQNLKLQQTLNTWKEKVQHLGKRMLHSLGFKDDELNADSTLSDFPDCSVKEAYESSIGIVQQVDPRALRVIPDSQNPGQYVLASKDNSGKYVVQESGFKTRGLAENKRKELLVSKVALDETFEETISKHITR